VSLVIARKNAYEEDNEADKELETYSGGKKEEDTNVEKGPNFDSGTV